MMQLTTRAKVLIKASKNSPLLSHFMFTNDHILFGESSKQQIEVDIKCLNEYC